MALDLGIHQILERRDRRRGHHDADQAQDSVVYQEEVERVVCFILAVDVADGVADRASQESGPE